MTESNRDLHGHHAKVGDQWRSEYEGDGSLRLVRQRTRGELILLVVFNLIWNGVVGMFTAIGLGWDFPGEYTGPTPGTPTFWLFLSPFLLRWGGDVYLFGRTGSQLTRNGRLAALGEIRGVRQEERTGDSDRAATYQLRVETTAGKKIAIGDAQTDGTGMETLAARLGEFLGVDVSRGNRSSQGSVSFGS